MGIESTDSASTVTHLSTITPSNSATVSVASEIQQRSQTFSSSTYVTGHRPLSGNSLLSSVQTPTVLATTNKMFCGGSVRASLS